ncbi:hypothetical protein CYMTET_5904 [Cymbomonas tetramitiformis]|uniref:Uncharacterized protein n=1 Tax=Cymbomonas tetramitiformis TaxID=36881 RepID=A0AAE0LIL7_9CHLO|nr:hypothetical protein CYMTET_5904 [Cymbomonas tetramitiformis]
MWQIHLNLKKNYLVRICGLNYPGRSKKMGLLKFAMLIGILSSTTGWAAAADCGGFIETGWDYFGDDGRGGDLLQIPKDSFTNWDFSDCCKFCCNLGNYQGHLKATPDAWTFHTGADGDQACWCKAGEKTTRQQKSDAISGCCNGSHCAGSSLKNTTRSIV